MKVKSNKISTFNPSSLGDKNSTIFGLPFSVDDANVVVLPVPWEVTVSYAAGTAKAPKAIFNASFQVDLYDSKIKDQWKIGIAMAPISKKMHAKSNFLRKKAEKYIGLLEKGKSSVTNKIMKSIQSEINRECLKLNSWVKDSALQLLNNKKIVALLGGDHSTPLGLIQALATKYSSFGILQIDAHADLRNAYEGLEFSHASIMYNALKINNVSKLIQVGIRDYCEDESHLIANSKDRIVTFFDRDIKSAMYAGKSWSNVCANIIKELPKYIYLSFDIDGLDPKLCPNTGTPVPGGLEYEQVLFLIEQIVLAGKVIISYDINEVAPGLSEWDANVAARLLYRISGLVAKSNGIVYEN